MDRTRSLFLSLFLPLIVILQTVPSALACGDGSTCPKLRKAGFSRKFIRMVSADRDEDDAKQILELNLLGFLGKGDYSGHHDRKAVPSCKAYLKKYAQTLRRVEKRYGVAKEVIVALLYVETKHGNYVGNLPVGATYYSLAHADTPEMIKLVYQTGHDRAPAYAGLREKIEERATSKSEWAIEQLKALDKMRKRGVNIRKLKGSYAGAFGLPQFIPSSYLSWARSIDTDAPPDLYRPQDAIASVAYYLKANGWKKKKPESHRAALYHYNHADGYVDVILEIAEASKASGN